MSNLLFVTVGQSFLQLPTCVKEAAHDGSLRYSQRFGDFLVAQPFELAQDDDGLMVARQDIERGLEPGGDFTPPQSIERIPSSTRARNAPSSSSASVLPCRSSWKAWL